MKKFIYILVCLLVYNSHAVESDVRYVGENIAPAKFVKCNDQFKNNKIQKMKESQCSAIMSMVPEGKNYNKDSFNNIQDTFENLKDAGITSECSCLTKQNGAELNDEKKGALKEAYLEEFYSKNLEKIAKTGQVLLKAFMHGDKWSAEIEPLRFCLPGNYSKALANTKENGCKDEAQKEMNVVLSKILNENVDSDLRQRVKDAGGTDGVFADIVSRAAGVTAFKYPEGDYGWNITNTTFMMDKYIDYTKKNAEDFDIIEISNKLKKYEKKEKLKSPLLMDDGKSELYSKLYMTYKGSCNTKKCKVKEKNISNEDKTVIDYLIYNSLLSGVHDDPDGGGFEKMFKKDNKKSEYKDKLSRLFKNTFPNLEKEELPLSNADNMKKAILSVQDKEVKNALEFCNQIKIATIESCQAISIKGVPLPSSVISKNPLNILTPKFYKDTLNLNDKETKNLYASQMCLANLASEEVIASGAKLSTDTSVDINKSPIAWNGNKNPFKKLKNKFKERFFSYFPRGSAIGSAVSHVETSKSRSMMVSKSIITPKVQNSFKSNSSSNLNNLEKKPEWSNSTPSSVEEYNPVNTYAPRNISKVTKAKDYLDKSIMKKEVAKRKIEKSIKVLRKSKDTASSTELKIALAKITQLEKSIEVDKLEKQKLDLEALNTKAISENVNKLNDFDDINSNTRAVATVSNNKGTDNSVKVSNDTVLSKSSSTDSSDSYSGKDVDHIQNNEGNNLNTIGINTLGTPTTDGVKLILTKNDIEFADINEDLIDVIKSSGSKAVLVEIKSIPNFFLQYVVGKDGNIEIDKDGEMKFLVRTLDEDGEYVIVEGYEDLTSEEIALLSTTNNDSSSNLKTTSTIKRPVSKWSRAMYFLKNKANL